MNPIDDQKTEGYIEFDGEVNAFKNDGGKTSSKPVQLYGEQIKHAILIRIESLCSEITIVCHQPQY